MKTLSIRQPWAWAILNAGKRIENRSWYCAHRGLVLLHAAKSMTMVEYMGARDFIGERGHDVPTAGDLERGGIVGRARIIDIIGPSGMCLGSPRERHRLADDPWYQGDYGFVLADVKPLPFVPWKGALGLFEVPNDAVDSDPPFDMSDGEAREAARKRADRSAK